ncbi:MAG: PfkB family carbohydrate kinase, partial [Bacteroidota bacterium]
SLIGQDDNGKAFTQLLKAEKLSTKGILPNPGRITTTKTRIIGNKHQMLRVDEEISAEISPAQRQNLLDSISRIIAEQKIDAIIFEDYDKGIISAALIDKVVQIAEKAGIPTTVDPKKNNFLAFRKVSLFKPNLRELKEGLNIELDLNVQKNLRKAVELLNKQLKNKITLITLSEHGVFISEGAKEYLIPAHVRTISDVSGAGDTVIAVATLCLAMKTPIEFLAALSNLAGGLVCEKVGVVPIDKEQLFVEAVNLLST